MELSGNDPEDLAYAKTLLENPGFAATLMNIVGLPFEKGFQYLPGNWLAHVQECSEKALHSALNFAILTIGKKRQKSSSNIVHKIAAAGSGCAGGLFGLPAVGIELPISTTIMLRSIADIARSEGENISGIETKLACIEVFAFGSRSESDNSAETGYYAIRAALSQTLSDAAVYVAEHGLSEAGAPILVRLITQISARFGIVVSEKTAASAIPIAGAAGGAIINTIFIDHFQKMARGHFIIRRLERQYEKEMVRAEYDKLNIET